MISGLSTSGVLSPPPDRMPTGQRYRRARWFFLTAALVLGAVLIVASASSYRGAVALESTVTRGQGAMHFHAIHLGAPPGPPPPTDANMEAVLEAQWDAGLRYIAAVGPGGHVRSSAGEPSPSFDASSARPGAEARAIEDGLVRMVAPGSGPPGRPPPHADGKAERKAPPPVDAKRGHRPPPPALRLVIEFEPVLAAALRARAARDLTIGLAGAGLLAIGSFVFWHLTRRADAAEARLAQQRHLAALGGMSAVMAHEIRNPLAGLKGHAQLLQEQLAGEPGHEKADVVVSEAIRLERLTNSLLDFARSGEVRRESLDPRELLQVAMADLDASRIDVDDTHAPDQWSLDPVRMRQVLVNLLENALQASPDGAHVEVAVRVEEGTLQVDVRDRGEGVPAEEIAQIFEPFHTTRVRGTGLGLAVVRRIVELHGGSVAVDNHPEGGARFHVSIPAS